MSNPRVVVDTNVVVSAVLTSGPAFKIIWLCQKRKIELLLSEEIIWEYYSVLSRDKFHLPASLIKTLMHELYSGAIIVKKKSILALIKDDSADNKFIETAVDGNADFIISGDKHLLDLKQYRNIKIVAPSSFL